MQPNEVFQILLWILVALKTTVAPRRREEVIVNTNMFGSEGA